MDSEWVNKMRPIHTRGYHPIFKRKEILTPAMTQMNLADIMLSNISQSRRVKHVCLHLCEVPSVVKPWRRKWQPTPVWPAEFRGQRDLAAFSPWGHRVPKGQSLPTLGCRDAVKTRPREGVSGEDPPPHEDPPR